MNKITHFVFTILALWFCSTSLLTAQEDLRQEELSNTGQEVDLEEALFWDSEMMEQSQSMILDNSDDTRIHDLQLKSCSHQYANIPYVTGFESGLDANWCTSSSISTGRILVTSANGPKSGSKHLTMDVSSNGSFSTNEARLGLRLAGQSNVQLSFFWREWNDETHAQDGVFFSDNGGISFTKVHTLQGATNYQQVILDVNSLAASAGLALTNNFVIKFQQYDNFSISTDGFGFDDIMVMAGTSCVNTFGYTESFETSDIGTWTQATDDDLDWTIHSGSTPTSGTGPDYTFYGTYYAYIEASGYGVGYPNKKATLISPCFDVSNLDVVDITFRKHMNGTTMGELYFDIWADGIWHNGVSSFNASDVRTNWTGIGSVNWFLNVVDKTNVQFRFRAITGSGESSDIAIDNFQISEYNQKTLNGFAGETMKVETDLDLDSPLENVIVRNFPNPFRDFTTLEYNLEEDANVGLKISDSNGRLVKVIMDGVQVEAGLQQTRIEAADLSAGIYFYELTINERRQQGKLVLFR